MVAMYKKIVVGVAIFSSPRETYITYLAVKAGWDKSQIGRSVAVFQEFHLQWIFNTTFLQNNVVSPHKFEPSQRYHSSCVRQ